MSSDDRRPVLLLVTANNCHVCVSLKPAWESGMAKGIATTGIVRIERLQLAEMYNYPSTMVLSDGREVKIPNTVKEYIQWYPTLLLINGSDWNDAMRDPSTILRMRIFNGQDVKGVAEILPIEQRVGMSIDNIVNWIRKETPGISVASEQKTALPLDTVPTAEATTELLPHVANFPKEIGAMCGIRPINIVYAMGSHSRR